MENVTTLIKMNSLLQSANEYIKFQNFLKHYVHCGRQ